MKYDECLPIETELKLNDNVVRNVKKNRVSLLDVFIAQSIICVAVSIGVMIYRLINISM